MRALIVSDSHGRCENLEKAILQVRPDRLYHLGDSQGQADYIRSICECPAEFVRGNCDWYSDLPEEVVLPVGNHRILLTHGHNYFVKYNAMELVAAAKKKECDTVLYGHTHYPQIEQLDGVCVVNPGSISLPRQENRRPSFVVMDVDRAGDLHFTLNYL